MRRYRRLCCAVLALTLAACGKPTIDQAQNTTFASLISVGTPTPTPEPSPTPTPEPAAVELPPPPVLTSTGTAFLLSTGGRELVLDFETGGRSGYDPRPEWPGGASGVTVGVGFDTGYYSRSVILSDWHELIEHDRTRLSEASGITGQRARQKARELHDIIVQWDIATRVFDNVDVAREAVNCKRAFPGFEDLRPNAQAALISLTFNRGSGLSGSNRQEMRNIRDLVPSRDYEGIALNLRKMVHVWRGTSIETGMRRRRLAEAKLVLTP